MQFNHVKPDAVFATDFTLDAHGCKTKLLMKRHRDTVLPSNPSDDRVEALLFCGGHNALKEGATNAKPASGPVDVDRVLNSGRIGRSVTKWAERGVAKNGTFVESLFIRRNGDQTGIGTTMFVEPGELLSLSAREQVKGDG